MGSADLARKGSGPCVVCGKTARNFCGVCEVWDCGKHKHPHTLIEILPT